MAIMVIALPRQQPLLIINLLRGLGNKKGNKNKIRRVKTALLFQFNQ